MNENYIGKQLPTAESIAALEEIKKRAETLTDPRRVALAGDILCSLLGDNEYIEGVYMDVRESGAGSTKEREFAVVRAEVCKTAIAWADQLLALIPTEPTSMILREKAAK